MAAHRPSLLRHGMARAFLPLAGAWTLVIAGMLGLTLFYSDREERTIALNRARDSYQKDLAYRRWASERGGVYVPLDARTPPNPYLAHLPRRDVTTDQGQRLTLVNPAYMTRMVHELQANEYGTRAHLTSLRPLRPENAPADWERRALASFETGLREFTEVASEAGRPVLRYMGAFLVEPGCLACHAGQGYRVGEIRGGLSVTVPVGAGTLAAGVGHKEISFISILAFWLLGGAGLFLWTRGLAAEGQAHDRMVQALEESARQFRQLFESSPAPMFIHRGGAFLDANAAAARLLDAEQPAQIIGQEVLGFIHPKYRGLAAERIHRVQSTHAEAGLAEEVLLTLRGREVAAVLQTVPLDLPDGPAVLAFAQDLTDQRRGEEDRRKLEVEIQHAQKLDSLGSLAGGIAHDMNNVLAAIMGMATLLQMKREGDTPLLKALGTIENAAARGRDLVKGLTDFARKGLQQPVTMDLNALVRRELDLLVRTSRQRFIFEVDLAEGLPPVLGEPSTLGSAIMNLCVNAFDAMPKGGRLGLRTWREGGWVCLEVADTGEGIPPELLHRVTEPFFTTKPVGRGTGLGLAMVYGTVKAHGGSLDIQSEVGQGTHIRFRLPSASAAPAREAAGSEDSDRDARPLRVLLVDDDELIRSTLPPMLEQLGHRVETASSGLEAIRRLGAGLEADLVILDHNMPGMTGAEALPRILQLRPDAQVVVATGFMDAELRRLLADFPAVHTLQKPFSLADLRRVLKEL